MIESIHIGASPRDVAEKLTRRIFEVADALDHPLQLAISGGSTPASLFSYWIEMPDELKRRKIEFWWVDERMVPQSSLDSNFGNAYRQFFGAVDYPTGLLHPISYDGSTTKSCAEAYNATFKGVDLVILGMGSDGHTSSLFPGQDLYDVRTPYLESIHPVNKVERVALSYHGIQATPKVFFHIMGADKRNTLQEVISLSQSTIDESKTYPAAFVMRIVPNVEIYTDIEDLKL